MEEQERAYYAVIPANVRYDKDLPANAKLLYGEITALCNERGYCWATNRYFAELYRANIITVSRWISALRDKGYITVYMERKGTDTKEVTRQIWVVTPCEKSQYPMWKNTIPPCEKSQYPHVKNHKENITDNTTVNITRNKNNKGASALIAGYTNNEELADALAGLIEARKAMKKPATEKAVKLLLNKLDKLASDDDTKTAIVNQSIERGWVSVFPLKQEGGSGGDGLRVHNRFTDAMRERGISTDY